jgi:hypothetical protein
MWVMTSLKTRRSPGFRETALKGQGVEIADSVAVLVGARVRGGISRQLRNKLPAAARLQIIPGPPQNKALHSLQKTDEVQVQFEQTLRLDLATKKAGDKLTTLRASRL